MPGIYVTFESFPGVSLALERLDPRQGRLHPELAAVRKQVVDGEEIEQATVFIPDGTLGHFLKRLDNYVATANRDKPRHATLLDPVQAISLASLEKLWTDPPEQYPSEEGRVWWEIWLRRRDGRELERLRAFAENRGIEVGKRALNFPDRVVTLVAASKAQLAGALDILDEIAELRQPREPAELIAGSSPQDQREWVDDLSKRTLPPPEWAPAVCVVDTGVVQGHPLLEFALAAHDCHACDHAWGTNDHHGHGTEMAGLALYGDLGAAILSSNPVELRHSLESVKFLPPSGENRPELYGAVTATAASLVEIQAPRRKRLFSITTTADAAPAGATQLMVGQPSSWSAAIDALAAGLDIDVADDTLTFIASDTERKGRLFLLAVGNTSRWEHEHLIRSDLEPAADPAQAWNAVAVGAYTDRFDIDSDEVGYEGWTPLAPRGDLSPFSRTSVTFGRPWPVKPDIVCEGGNLARSPHGNELTDPDTLSSLTTKAPKYDARLLTVTRATSAATSQAAFIAATVIAEYPDLSPEAVRALVVHSAEWTPAMRQHFDGATTRAAKGALHRRYGAGVPESTRAIYSATDALTLVTDDLIRPFDGNGRMREMHLHELPWPTEVLTGLGDARVRLRVTLSYFVEPNPSRRGWTGRYQYASHGLRFDVRLPTETTEEFRKRVNDLARSEEDRGIERPSGATEWFFGPDHRSLGSLHWDIWDGTAADLAQRGIVAVYPVSGWWKTAPRRARGDWGARYALVVSIEAPEQEVDLWTPVAEQVAVTVEVPS